MQQVIYQDNVMCQVMWLIEYSYNLITQLSINQIDESSDKPSNIERVPSELQIDIPLLCAVLSDLLFTVPSDSSFTMPSDLSCDVPSNVPSEIYIK